MEKLVAIMWEHILRPFELLVFLAFFVSEWENLNVFQPVFKNNTGKVFSVSLGRLWTHPYNEMQNLGLCLLTWKESPTDFIMSPEVQDLTSPHQSLRTLVLDKGRI